MKHIDPIAWTVERVDWCLFGTFTFTTPMVLRLINGKRKEIDHAWIATLRYWARKNKIDPKGLQWVRREEKGRKGRPHFHALFRGLDTNALSISSRFVLMAAWSRFTADDNYPKGAISQVRRVRPGDANAVSTYTVKNLGIDPDSYEIGRFKVSLVASPAFIRFARRNARALIG